jgi:hypothetical protein
MKRLIARVRAYVAKRRKAYTAAAATLIGGWLLKQGFDLSGEQEVALLAAINRIFVWLVPNAE